MRAPRHWCSRIQAMSASAFASAPAWCACESRSMSSSSARARPAGVSRRADDVMASASCAASIVSSFSPYSSSSSVASAAVARSSCTRAVPPSTLSAWSWSVRWNAATLERRRFCKFTNTSRPVPRSGRISSVYSASISARRSSTGSPSPTSRAGANGVAAPFAPFTEYTADHFDDAFVRSTRITSRRGNSARSATRRSSFSRRTITASRAAGLTSTPRVKRFGSSISRSAEKLFECPLCGVAERNRRFSNRGVMSRMTFVIRESSAMNLFVPDGAAVCASSRMSIDLRARSPRCWRSGSRCSGRRSVW